MKWNETKSTFCNFDKQRVQMISYQEMKYEGLIYMRKSIDIEVYLGMVRVLSRS